MLVIGDVRLLYSANLLTGVVGVDTEPFFLRPRSRNVKSVKYIPIYIITLNKYI